MPSQEDYLDNLLKDMSGDKVSEDVVAEDKVWEDVESEEKAPEDIASEDKVWEDAESEEKAPEDIASENKAWEDAESEDEVFGNMAEELPEKQMQGADSAPDSAPEEYIDADTVGDLTEEEIERLLSAGTETAEELSDVSDMELSDEDVMKLLQESDDSNLQDIQELLEKADNNVAVDDSIADLLQEAPEEDLEAKILGDEEEALAAAGKKSEHERKEQARARRREKKEQAAAKKAEKKAEREAAKAAQKSRRDRERNQQQPEDWDSPTEEGTDEKLLDDMAVLDSIVSQASGTGQGDGIATEDIGTTRESEKTPSGEDPIDIFAADARDGAMPEEPGEGKDASDTEDDGLGFDLDSLFGGGDDSLLGGEGGSDFGFPDFAEPGDEGASAAGTDGIFEEEGTGLQELSGEKKGFFSRIMDYLTEEEDEEEEENENIRLSQENKDILKDLDKEEKDGKKKKRKKGKNEKKSKEKEEPEKKAKPKRKPKVRKEPKKQPRETLTVHDRRLSFKKVLPVVLVGISLGVLLFVFINAAADYTDKREARAAYYEGDYQTCYQNLFGKELDETESVMFGKSESILYIRLWLREYEMFAEEGSRVEALDSLIQTVDSYPELYAYAAQWNAEEEVAAGYAAILNILSQEFGLTEAEAKEIAAERSDVTYTRMVTAIAQGKAFGSWNQPEPSPEPEMPPEDTMEDKLPEEDELGQDTFIVNQ